MSANSVSGGILDAVKRRLQEYALRGTALQRPGLRRVSLLMCPADGGLWAGEGSHDLERLSARAQRCDMMETDLTQEKCGYGR
jgi:hypothetical protein